mmetsp:Transcript_35758/g.52400  ORF Transcript_35758/g.52400 Transcript_35758/m.52400 type:complete len:416 (+) Transcript_35758:109-1356(+)
MRMRTASKLLLSSALAAQAHAIWLDEKIMTLSLNAAKLSDLSYIAHEEPDGSLYGMTLDDAHYYVSEDSPDTAIVTKVDGYCYGVFRGTESTNLDDWKQNIDPRTDEVCNDDGGCCDARQGFVRAYEAPFKDQFEADLVECAASCDDPDECVVLTGHSQGGAIANLAAIINVDLNPYVITFGQPAAVHEPCPYINSEKYYHYINSVMDGDELEHDVVPFGPGLGSSFFGYMIIVSPQSDAVANYGLNAYPDISDFHLNIEPFKAHSMDGGEEGFGYIQRIEALMSHDEYPIPAGGWHQGDACSDDGECISGFCNENLCSGLLDSCESCDDNEDCISGNCYLGSCTRIDQQVDNGCSCFFSSDCDSGRCDSLECMSRLPNGSSCNEDSDCISDSCGWWSGCYGDDGARASLMYNFY